MSDNDRNGAALPTGLGGIDGQVDIYTRYLVRQHLWRVFVVVVLIVAIVTPIHVGSRVDDTWEAAVEHGRSGAWDLFLFVGLRATDVLSQTFPIAFFLGLLWSEASLSLSGRRLMTQIAGRSIAAGVPALLAVAALSVPVQFLLQNYARPHAVLALVDHRIGTYRQYMAGENGPHGNWVSAGDRILQARTVDRYGREFGDVTLYAFAAGNRLQEVLVAARIVPDPASGRWRAEDGYSVTIPEAAQPGAVASGGPAGSSAIPFDARILDLGIDPLWMRYNGIKPIYIPLADLVRLARSTGIPADQPDYAAGLQVRLAKSFIPALLGVLAAGTFLLAVRRRSVMRAAGISLGAAYLGVAASDAAGAFGQSPQFAGAVGAWLSPLLLLALCALILWRLRRAAGPAPAARPVETSPGPEAELRIVP
jgi:lipopolysaccharide export LptBFGC system permease protein LptF